MAVFNPSPPQTNDPNWLNWSKPISQPDANKSTAYLLQGSGELIEGGLKAADTLVKQKIESDVSQDVITQRDAYTLALQTAENQVGAPKDSLTGDTKSPDVPNDLKSFPSAINAFAGARANGRLSETYYYGRLDAIAKDYRSRFPGYRDYIDKTISEITGVTPANAYIKSILGDINAATTKGQQELEHVLTDLRKASNEGMPQADEMYALIRATGDVQRGVNFLNQQNARKYQIAQRTEERNDETGTLTDRKRAAEAEADLISNSLEADHWDKIKMGNGVNSAKDINDFLLSGKAIDSATAQRLAIQMHASRAMYEESLRAKFFRIDPTTQRSLALDLGGPDVANKTIKERLARWDTTADLIGNEKFGLAEATQRITKSIIDQAQYGLVSNKDLGPWMANLAAMQKISPQYVEKFFAQLLAADIDQLYKPYISAQVAKLVAQPDYANTGIVNTFKKVMEETQAKGIDAPKTYEQYIKLMETITDPTAETQYKKQIALATFHEQNVGMLNQFKDDTVVQGRRIPGKFSVYNRLGTDDFVKSMKGLNDETSWGNYMSWMGKSFGDLNSQEIQNLNKVQASHYLYVTWNSDANRWGLHQVGDLTKTDLLLISQFVPRVETSRANPAAAEEVAVIKQSLNKLNGSIKTLSRVVTADGGEPNAVILQHMINAGLTIDPNKAPQGIPDQMIRAMIKSREDAAPSSKWFDKGTDMPSVAPLQYTEEAKPKGDLGTFLQNPAGEKKPVVNKNLSSEDLLNIDVQDIPPGMSARDFLQQLRNKKK